MPRQCKQSDTNSTTPTNPPTFVLSKNVLQWAKSSWFLSKLVSIFFLVLVSRTASSRERKVLNLYTVTLKDTSLIETSRALGNLAQITFIVTFMITFTVVVQSRNIFNNYCECNLLWCIYMHHNFVKRKLSPLRGKRHFTYSCLLDYCNR